MKTVFTALVHPPVAMLMSACSVSPRIGRQWPQMEADQREVGTRAWQPRRVSRICAQSEMETFSADCWAGATSCPRPRIADRLSRQSIRTILLERISQKLRPLLLRSKLSPKGGLRGSKLAMRGHMRTGRQSSGRPIWLRFLCSRRPHRLSEHSLWRERRLRASLMEDW